MVLPDYADFDVWIGGVLQWVPIIKYVGGIRMWFPNVDRERLYYGDIIDMYTKGGGKALNIAVYYCLPGLSLDNGIRPLNGDDGIRELLRAYRGLENNAAGPQDTRNDFSRPSDSRNDIGTDNNNARPSDSRNEHNPETDTQTEDISLFSDDHAFEAPAQSSQTTTDQMAQNMSQTASNTVDILPPRLVTSMSAFTQPMRSAERQTFTQPMRTAQRQAFTQPMRTAQRPLSSAILQRLRRPNQHGSRPVFFTQRPSNQQQREVTTQFRSPFEVPPQCNNNAQKGPHRKCQEEESKWFQFPEHPNYRSALKVQVVHFKEDVAQQTNKQLCKHY
ncbi:hypothetical protein Salat_0438600 [Sesamum alatum]|uniref:PB1-like domain-containing protein n=1 Tax=Sesamum alatum TaxID=300844 RepID=A0AAE1Z361_9LAMI|nr:hypothetical protein Salat_0438600 [Sesamum alatum]